MDQRRNPGCGGDRGPGFRPMSKRTETTPLMATSLTVEGSAQCLTAPAAPVFGWLLDAGTSASAGQMVQTAYRLRVLDHTGKDVWDSGTVVTGQQHHRPYTGPDLAPDNDYQWTVQLTDATGATGIPSKPSYFSTGLASTGLPGAAGWTAEWIHREPGGRAPLELVGGFLRVSGSPCLPWPVAANGSTTITARFRLRLGTAGILLRSDGPGSGVLLEIKPNRSALLRPAPEWEIGAMSAPHTEPLAETPAFGATGVSRAGALPVDGWQDLVIADDGERITVTIDGDMVLDARVPGTASEHAASRSTKDHAARPSTRGSPSTVAGPPSSTQTSPSPPPSPAGAPPLPSGSRTNGPSRRPPSSPGAPLSAPAFMPLRAITPRSPSTAARAWRPPTSATRESTSTTPPTSLKPCRAATPPP